MFSAKTGNPILLPGLRRLAIYVGCGDLDTSALIQSAKARKERSRSLREVTIIFENEPEVDLVQELGQLTEIVGELDYRVGVTPVLRSGRVEMVIRGKQIWL